MCEVWKPVPDYEGYYEASSLGRVRSVDREIAQESYVRLMRGRVLKQAIRPDGYRVVAFSRENVRVNRLVHQIVCETFHGRRPKTMNHTRHLNGDRGDNSPENLAWGTGSENAIDTIAHGRNKKLQNTECPSGHPYDEDNTVLVQRKGRGRGLSRQCRVCLLESYRRYNAKRPV